MPVHLLARLGLLAVVVGLAVTTSRSAVGASAPDPAVAPVSDTSDAMSNEVAATQVITRVVVGPELRQPLLDLSPTLREALLDGEWLVAERALARIDPSTLAGHKKGSVAFLRAWCLVRARKGASALALLPLMTDAPGVPSAYLALVRGEVLRAADQPLAALNELAKVPHTASIWPRAAVQQAELLREVGRTKEAYEVYERLASQPHPATGGAQALLALAKRKRGSEESYRQLRTIWTQYPGSPASDQGWPLLKAYDDVKHRPTWQAKGVRSYRLMRQGRWNDALKASEGVVVPKDDRSDEACMLLFARGRSYYKKRHLTSSITALKSIGPRCTDASEDWGARGIYLAGRAQYRRGLHGASAATLRKIPALYPDSSYADDGYLHAGLALQEAGKMVEAREVWLRSTSELPMGDTTPEATWRVAWSHYLEGNPEEAVAVATRLGALSLHSERRHVEAGRYWAARWTLYPDVDNPQQRSDLPDALERAVAQWRALCEDLPHSYYSVLAYSRLVEVAPKVAAALNVRPKDHDRGDLSRPWKVRLAFMQDPHVRNAVDLSRLGLPNEARTEWHRASVGELEPDEMAWRTELRIGSGDWLFAHDNMKQWLKKNPPGTLGEGQPQVLRIGYPDHFWDEVQGVTKGYRYEPRLFHALVREESNFNPEIRSPVGARGLSQLMPATARQTAGWLRMDIKMSDLDVPTTNLTIGARYLEAVHKEVGSPYLSLAGYNAGPGRVRQWLGQWGNVPTDEYVERIPYRETRGYVRRVTTTWQTYKWQFDEGDAFPDLSKYNHHAKP